jgi:F-type H+-transporting ATPase subunit delta
MSEITTIARPYARAVFEMARSTDSLAEWSSQLELLATIAATPEVAALIESPRLTRQERAETVARVAEGHIQPAATNLLRLLADNDRLSILPDVAAIYEHLRADAEGSVEAQVTSAYPLGQGEQDEIAAGLRKRLGREVRLVCEVDETLLGGALIHVGDLVIDGSVRGRLGRMAATLSR